MGSRALLGAADVSDAELARILADWIGTDVEQVTVDDCRVDDVPYDLPSITTAGRHWVSGTATTPEGSWLFRFFVKQVQSWVRSPWFAAVPPEFREMAAAGVPWRTEALVYRSDLAERLPRGLTMPRAVAVHDLDELSAAIWLEAVPALDGPWGTALFEHAAHLLGRLAGSAAVRPLASIGEADARRSVREYAEGRLAAQVAPMLRDDSLWAHPVLAQTFGEGLRGRLLDELGHVAGFVDELESVPLATAHGDACPNNLLRTAGSDDLVLVDYAFWSTQPIGFDLGQLLLGDVQIGRSPASTLGEVEAVIVPAYRRGLADEGIEVDEAVLRRAHALQALLFSGFSALPFEVLDREPTPEVFAQGRERAAIATFLLDLVAATPTVPPGPDRRGSRT